MEVSLETFALVIPEGSLGESPEESPSGFSEEPLNEYLVEFLEYSLEEFRVGYI